MFERIRSLIELKAGIFDCFTTESLEVIAIAESEARSLRHCFIGTEHILLGLIAEREGMAGQVLTAHGVELGKARLEVARFRGASKARIPNELPFTPSAKRLLEEALKHSKSSGLSYVCTEHLLLALVIPERGAAVKVLRDLGISLDALTSGVRTGS